MKRLLIAAALALPAIPAIASAEDYASPGQLEAGGLFGIQSQTETRKPDGGDEFDTVTTSIQIQPQVGYFITNGLELIGALQVQTFSEKVDDGDPTTFTAIGLGAGAGYFVNLGVARVGPQMIVRIVNLSAKVQSATIGEIDFTDQRIGAQVGAFAKVPVGGGGVISAGLALDYDNVAQTFDADIIPPGEELEPTGTAQTIGVRFGYFVYF